MDINESKQILDHDESEFAIVIENGNFNYGNKTIEEFENQMMEQNSFNDEDDNVDL